MSNNSLVSHTRPSQTHFLRQTGVREGDIKSCFVEIDQKWLIQSIPMDTQVLKKVVALRLSGQECFIPYPSRNTSRWRHITNTNGYDASGTEQCVKAVCKPSDKVQVLAYADNFIVTASSKGVLTNKVKAVIEHFLTTQGLRLSQEKTTITHIDKGFDFSGFTIRKYKERLLIKPAKSNCLKFLRTLARGLMGLRAESAATVIRVLNPKIRGWSNYYRHVVSRQIFSTIAHRVLSMTWRWARKRHPSKKAAWVKRKYYATLGDRHWVFYGHERSKQRALFLFSPTTVSIERHVKIKSEANSYDPAFAEYFTDRRQCGSSSPSPSVIEKVLA